MAFSVRRRNPKTELVLFFDRKVMMEMFLLRRQDSRRSYSASIDNGFNLRDINAK